MNDRNKIAGAFRELRKMGWFARMDFWCCQSCGCAALPDKCTKYVFFHNQDAEAFNEEGNIGNHERWERNQRKELYMSHGDPGDANMIVAILNKHGLTALWDGDNDRRIQVLHKE